MKRTVALNYRVFVLMICFSALAISLHAQSDQSNIRFTQGQVNDGATLSFDIPVGSYPGRGISLPIALNYSSSVWRIEHIQSVKNHNVATPYYVKQSVTQAVYSEHSQSGWRSTLDIPQIEWPKNTEKYDYKGRPSEATSYNYRVAKVTLHMPDGSAHEFRKSDQWYIGGIDTGGEFYAVDGSRMRYYSTDEDTGTLFLPDGTRYILDAGSCQIIDRMGNSITYNGSTRQWTDTLGRVFTNPLPSNPSAQDYYYHLPGLPGVNNGVQTFIFRWKNLSDVLTPDANNNAPAQRYVASHYLSGASSAPTDSNGGNFPLEQSADHQSLFQSAYTPDEDPPVPYPVPTLVVGKDQPGGQLFNPVVLAEIISPDGSKYKFSYNVYGEIDKVVYPTGAYDKYAYDPMISAIDEYKQPYVQASRKINSHIASVDGTGSDAREWKYSQTASSGLRLTRVIAPDKTRTEMLKYDIPEPGDSTGKTYWPFGISDTMNGLVFEKRMFSTSSDGLGGQLLRRELTKYAQSVFTYQYTAPGITPAFTKTISATRNSRPVKQVSILFEGGGPALAQGSEFVYDTTNEFTNGLEQTVAKVFDYSAVSNTSPADLAQAGTIDNIPQPASPIKYTETTYQNDSGYQMAYILGLPASVTVKDGSSNAVLSRSEMIYDESGYTHDGSTRGLLTSQKTWDSTKGDAVTPGAYLVSHAKFDQWGNRTETQDAMGNKVTTTYDPTYHIFPVSVTSPVPDTSGAYGSATAFTVLSSFDPTTGLVLSTTDVNGQTTLMEYNDPLLRLKKVTAPNGQQTITEYGAPDGNGILQASQRFVYVKTQIDTARWSEAYSWFDGAGRTYQTRKIDTQGDVYVDTEFDNNTGRVKRSTSPYRTGETKRWTTPTYDDLSRTTKVTTPDATATPTTVDISYGLSTSGVLGTTKTITDQAGKKRKGIVDGAGNMVRVIEDPDGDNLVTDYVFDKLSNLRKTTQGSQNRYFMYDSLGRVMYARQVEQDANASFSGSSYTDPVTGNTQWSVKYLYDDNGNIMSTTDPRGKTISASYDHLNRLVARDYSDAAMPDVSFYYDGKGLGSIPAHSKGKTTRISSSVSDTRYTSFDGMGNLLSSQQITDGNTYNFQYAYNLSNALVRQVYPSGRVVRNDLSPDGRLARVSSSKNSTSGLFTYADNVTYNSTGAVTRLQLGNGHWETTSYNERQQITQIGLGTSDSSPNLLKLEFSYTSMNAHDNNGSLREQKITVPTAGAAAGFVATQSYDYDSLNRIKSTTETIGGSQTWKQTFDYDRYGNRRLSTAGGATTTLGNCAQAICNPTINAANNRFSSGQFYNYDASGNLTANAEGWTFAYDSEDHQVEVKNDEGITKGLYFYDANGNRVKKVTQIETTIFVYDASGKLAAEYSTKLADMPQVNYLTMDHLGSPRIITGAGGEVVSRKDFSAFGEESITAQRTSALGYAANEVRQDYTGYQKDDESGLKFAQARYYSNQHGRFTSVDPLISSANVKNPQTLNRYSYVINSPYKFTDPLGLMAVFWSGIAGNVCSAELNNCDNNTNNELGDYPQRHPVSTGGRASQTGYNETTKVFTTTMVDGSLAAQITITITTRDYAEYDSAGGEIVSPGTPRSETDAPRVVIKDVAGRTAYTDQQKTTIRNVVKDIIAAATSMGVETRIAIAMGIKESKLGTGAVTSANKDKNGVPLPWKLPDVNPLQLSAACGTCKPRAKSGVENRAYNIRGALQVFKDLNGNVAKFGGEGVAPTQRNYSAGVMKYFDAITETSSTRWVCTSGCR